MRRYGTRYIGILLFSMTAIFAEVAFAEIYKWVDTEGNIHFGDKPRDRALADQAEPVDIIESYQPTERTAGEQEAYDREQQAIKRRRQMYQQEEQEGRTVAQDKHKEEKAALCAAYEEDINKLTSMDVTGRVRAYYYLKGEDGKSVSSERQKEIVEELKRKYVAAGCN